MGALSKREATTSDQKQSNTGARLEKPQIMRIYSVQLVFLLIVSLLLLIESSTLALSGFIGGLIAIVPNMYFAKWAFKYAGAKSASQVAQSFYRGEAGKFVLTTVLFAATFILLRPVSVVVLFLVYIVMMLLNWILAVRCLRQH